MIETYAIINNQLMVLEADISLSQTDEEIYNIIHQMIKDESINEGGFEFRILLIKHNMAFIRNIGLNIECCHRYFDKEFKSNLKEWLSEFTEIFGDLRNKEIREKWYDSFSDELSERNKGLYLEYDNIISKHGIPTEARFEKKIRGLGVANK